MKTSADFAPRPHRRGIVPIISILFTIAALVGVALVAIPAATGMSIGATLAEMQGKTLTRSYENAAAVPASDAPAWLPSSATDVRVRQPGLDTGATGIAVDATIPTGTALPSFCAAQEHYSQPWDGGMTWPKYQVGDIHRCNGWSVVWQARHVYLWQ